METHQSVSARKLCFSSGRVSRPRARGDQGMLPTPNIYYMTSSSEMVTADRRARPTNLECREHFALLLTINEVVVILHRDEGRELVLDRIVYRTITASDLSCEDRGCGTDFALRGL